MKSVIISYLASVVLLVSLQASGQIINLPENLGPQVNSTYDEINPVIAPGGQALYFTRVNHPENNFGEGDSEDIWMTELQPDGTWSEATRLQDLNIGRYNAILSISEDGNTILLNGVYNKRGNTWKKRGLSVASRTGAGWTIPQNLKVPSLSKLNEGIKSSASMSADGRFLVLSFSAKYNGERTDLFISKKKSNERWSRPKKIKKANSNASEDAPFLSFDNKTLYFASDRKKKNTFDIYKMVRDSEAGRWSAPVLLGDTVNSAHWDSYFKTNATGRTAYFSSTRVTANGADLYTVDLAQPGSPNKNNSLVTVSGNIKDVLSSKTLIGQKFTVEVDGYPEDGITVSMDSASYRLRLPAGKQYILSASASGFGSIADTVDLSAATNLRRINNDLYLRPNPNVTIKGRMLVRSDESIPAKNVSGIIINGILCDSATIDLQQGTYEVNLKPGVAYSIKMVAEDLESVPAQLDLSGTENNREIILDLYALPKKVAQIAPVIKSVEAIKIVLVSGDIVNKKTGASLGQNSLIKINIEGSDIAPKIDPATGKYEARVPIGKNYTFSAAAPGFYPIYETIDVSQNDNSVSRTLYLVPVEVGQSIRLNNIFFEPGKAVLKKTSFPELNRVVSFLEDNADMKIEIAGHTDNVGQASTNQKLSLARAQAVATYLTAHGVNPSNIVTKGYGSVNPISSNETADGKARNRRVEFTILTR